MGILGIHNFIIVFLFSIYWITDDFHNYIDMYNWKENRYWSIYFSGFNIWGIINLIYFFIYQL